MTDIFEKNDRDIDRIVKLAIVGWLLQVTLWLGFGVTIIWVAWHFIFKYW